jgi:hypothetical protein
VNFAAGNKISAEVDSTREMRAINPVKLSVGSGLSTVATLLSAPSLYALACPICYGANSTQTIEALKKGYLFLLFPPILILGGIFYLAYQKRSQFEKDAETSWADHRKGLAAKAARTSRT